MHIYIGFETLKVKCTQYGICSQTAFKNARAMFFLKLGGAGRCFRSGLKKSQAGAKNLREGCPCLDLTPLEVCGGDFNIPLYSSEEVYSFIDSFRMIIDSPEVLNFNQFICN